MFYVSMIQISLVGVAILAGLLVLGYIGDIICCATQIVQPIDDWVEYWESGVIICFVVFLIGVICMVLRI